MKITAFNSCQFRANFIEDTVQLLIYQMLEPEYLIHIWIRQIDDSMMMGYINANNEHHTA